MENGAAGAPTEFTVRGDPPVLAMENVCVAELPTATVPNARDAGVT